MTSRLQLAFLGLSITSSWGNGHAAVYRALLSALASRGHQVTFLERDLEYHAKHRDLPAAPFARTLLYGSLDELRDRYTSVVRESDLVVVGSFVPEGIDAGTWAQRTAPGKCVFYDLETPVTLTALERNACRYLTRELVAGYAMHLSTTGGPILRRLERDFGAAAARVLYPGVSTAHYFPIIEPSHFELAYLGTYRDDRQAALERLLLDVARERPQLRFAVAGAQYPKTIRWPSNVEHDVHLAPSLHRRFYAEQRWALDLGRRAMVSAGWSPSTRLFEAAACATPIIAERWKGLDEILSPGREVFVADGTADVVRFLEQVREEERRRIADAARRRVLAEHTAMHRAESFERYASEVLDRTARRSRTSGVRTQAVAP